MSSGSYGIDMAPGSDGYGKRAKSIVRPYNKLSPTTKLPHLMNQKGGRKAKPNSQLSHVKHLSQISVTNQPGRDLDLNVTDIRLNRHKQQ